MNIAAERLALAEEGLDIRWREEWGAVTDYTTARPVEQAIALFLHIAVVDDPDDLVGSEHQVMRNIERIGRTRFGASIGISYNAAAFDTGRLYEGQPLERRGAHTVNDLPNPAFRTGGLNHLVRALVLPQQVTDDVTDAQVDAAARWGAALCRAGFAKPGARWFGHRDVTRKACPGEAAYRRLGELEALTRHYEAHGLQEDDMPLSDEDVRKVAEAVWARKVHFLGDQRQPATLVMRDIATHARAGARGIDVPALAEALAARLPGTSGPVRVEDLKTALVEVLGSLDEGTG